MLKVAWSSLSAVQVGHPSITAVSPRAETGNRECPEPGQPASSLPSLTNFRGEATWRFSVFELSSLRPGHTPNCPGQLPMCARPSRGSLGPPVRRRAQCCGGSTALPSTTLVTWGSPASIFNLGVTPAHEDSVLGDGLWDGECRRVTNGPQQRNRGRICNVCQVFSVNVPARAHFNLPT